MRVALDLSCLFTDRASGLRRYASNLARALLDMQDPGLELVGFAYYWRGGGFCPADPRVAWRVARLPRRLLEWSWRRLDWPPLDWLTGRVDAFHSIHLNVPPRRHGARVLTIHDLREYRLPHLFPHLQALRPWRERMARRADRVVAVSETTRGDVIRLMGVDPARVRVIPNALEREFCIPPDPDLTRALRERLGLNRPYVLFVSSADPRKGHEDALRAWDTLRREVDLVVVGAVPRWMQREWFRVGARQVGVVEDADYLRLLGAAEALLHPSYHEGFGLPILEAFGVGIPVVGYDTEVMREVAGEAALLVPTGDHQELSRMLAKALADSGLRQELRQRGRLRLGAYDWARSARLLMTVYREVVEERC